MKKPRDTYPRAWVPEYLTTLTIDKAPVDTVFYVEPGEVDAFGEEIAVLRTPDHQLVMDTTFSINAEDKYPESPSGLVGVMRTILVNQVSGALEVHYVADLRFIDNYMIVDAEKEMDPNDQEQFMSWAATLQNAAVFSAFIAADEEAEMSEKGLVEGNFYGDERLHDSLEFMEKLGDKKMKRYVKRLNTNAKLAKKATKAAEQESNSSVSTQPDQTKKPSADLAVTFSHQQ